MLTKLPNGNHLKLSEVLSIKVVEFPIAWGNDAHHWAVDVRHGDGYMAETERVDFASKAEADAFAEDLAGRASVEQKEEFDRLVERDTRRERDRHLDRVAIIASGLFSGDAVLRNPPAAIIEDAARFARRIAEQT